MHLLHAQAVVGDLYTPCKFMHFLHVQAVDGDVYTPCKFMHLLHVHHTQVAVCGLLERPLNGEIAEVLDWAIVGDLRRRQWARSAWSMQ